jgi:hypothetical protein
MERAETVAWWWWRRPVFEPQPQTAPSRRAEMESDFKSAWQSRYYYAFPFYRLE